MAARGYDAKFPVKAGSTGHYWNVFLWPECEPMWAHLNDEERLCTGCHHPRPYYIDVETGARCPKPLLGDIHFVKGRWDMEVVAHECLHAVSYFIEAKGTPPFGDPKCGMQQEEVYCYAFGKLVDGVYRGLWDRDPYRTEEEKQ